MFWKFGQMVLIQLMELAIQKWVDLYIISYHNRIFD